jgi:hypothetical protein
MELRPRVADFADVTALEGGARAAVHQRRDVRLRVQGRDGARIGPRTAQRDHFSDEQIEGVVGRQRSRRQMYFYQHADHSGAHVQGHAGAAEAGIATVFLEAVLQPRRPRPRAGVGLRRLLRMCRRASRDVRHHPSHATRRAAESRGALCHRRARVAGPPRSPLVAAPARGHSSRSGIDSGLEPRSVP